MVDVNDRRCCRRAGEIAPRSPRRARPPVARRDGKAVQRCRALNLRPEGEHEKQLEKKDDSSNCRLWRREGEAVGGGCHVAVASRWAAVFDRGGPVEPRGEPGALERLKQLYYTAYESGSLVSETTFSVVGGETT